jgi:hypothetical protein
MIILVVHCLLITYTNEDQSEEEKVDIAWAIIGMLGSLIAVYAIIIFGESIIGAIKGIRNAYRLWKDRKSKSSGNLGKVRAAEENDANVSEDSKRSMTKDFTIDHQFSIHKDENIDDDYGEAFYSLPSPMATPSMSVPEGPGPENSYEAEDIVQRANTEYDRNSASELRVE